MLIRSQDKEILVNLMYQLVSKLQKGLQKQL